MKVITMHDVSPDAYLYSSYKLDITLEDPDGKTKNLSATGFMLTINEGGIPWIVTNRHVVDLDYGDENGKYRIGQFKITGMTITGRQMDDSVHTFELSLDAAKYYHSDQYNDVAIMEPKVIIKEGQSSEFALGYLLSHVATPEELEKIRVADLILYTGYPGTHDKMAIRPLLRRGHIASDPSFDYSWSTESRGSCIAYEGHSHGGSSGSPIILPPRGQIGMPDFQRGKLIGVNAGHLYEAHKAHGAISYFFRSTVILDIIKENGLN